MKATTNEITHYPIENLSGLTHLWEQTKGDSSICIAVIDSTINYNHNALKEANLSPINSLQNTQITAHHHGTSVASIIFGQHNSPLSRREWPNASRISIRFGKSYWYRYR